MIASDAPTTYYLPGYHDAGGLHPHVGLGFFSEPRAPGDEPRYAPTPTYTGPDALQRAAAAIRRPAPGDLVLRQRGLVRAGLEYGYSEPEVALVWGASGWAPPQPDRIYPWTPDPSGRPGPLLRGR